MSDETKKVLSKADLLSGVLLKRKLVYVEDWGASVWLRQLSGEHMLELKQRKDVLLAAGVKETTQEQDFGILTWVLSCSLCDENGALMLTEEEARGLVVNSFNTLLDVTNKVFELSGIAHDGTGKLSNEVIDNLPNAPTISSSQSSPSNSDEQGARS